MLLAKTCMASLTWHSTKCLMTWKLWGIKQKRIIYQLTRSERTITEIEFGSSVLKATHMIPTPTASDHIKRECTSKEMLNFNTNKSVSLDRWFRNVYGKELTPEFSEILMGYPIGWTELKE